MAPTQRKYSSTQHADDKAAGRADAGRADEWHDETPYTDMRGRAFLIREARADDAAAFLAYMRPLLNDNQYYRIESDEWGWTIDQERDYLADYARSPTKAFFVALRQGKIIGHLECRTDARRRVRHVAEIGMGVARTDWRCGIGAALMEHAEQWARETGVIRVLILWVFATNTRARALYAKMGFTDSGRKPRAVLLPDGPDDEILMVKELA